MKRSLAILGTAIVFSVGLVGCSGGYDSSQPAETVETEQTAGTPGGEADSPYTDVFVQELPDGREVLCVWAVGYKSGGLSCDWDSIVEVPARGVE